MSVFTGSKRQRTGATFVPAEDTFEDTTIAGDLTVTGDTTVEDVTANGNATVGGTLAVTGNSTFTGMTTTLGAAAFGASDFVWIQAGQIGFYEGVSSLWAFIQRSNQLAPGVGAAADDLIIAADGGVWIQADKNDNFISGNKAFAVQYRTSTDPSTARLFEVDDRGWIKPTVRASDPVGEAGSVYYNSGAGTDHGFGGLRVLQGGSFADIPIYSQGTFTPIIGDGTNDFTMTTQVGRYVRTGNHVHAEVQIVYSGKGSASGPLVIQGVPFTRLAAFGAQWGSVWQINLEGAVPLNAEVVLRQVNAGNQNINLVFSNKTTGAVTNVTAADLFSGSGTFYASIDWIVDDTWPTN